MARVQVIHPAYAAGAVLDVAVSERNLIVLLSKLYTPGSACTIQFGDLPTGLEMGWLRAEPDEIHYASPTRGGAPPGPMHPFAETVLVEVRRAIAAVLSQTSGGGVHGPRSWRGTP